MQHIQDRFWSKVQKSDGCWLWVAGRNKKGYGVFQVSGVAYYAHRLSFEFSTGKKIPAGLFACHTCDQPSCVRPDHIFLGTAKDNLQDAAKKGRCVFQKRPELTRGEANGRAKLTADNVRKIRNEIQHSSYSKIGRQFGITHTQVRNIVLRNCWKDVA